MKILMILPVIALLWTCTAIKKDVETNKQTTASLVKLKQLAKMDTKIISLRDDSSYTEVEIELVPKGKFSYSPNKGFEGEAGSVRIVKKETLVSQQQRAERLSQQTAVNVKEEKAEKEMVKTVHTKRFSFNWIVITACLLLMAFIYYKLIR